MSKYWAIWRCPALMAEGVRGFDDLHAAWERVLDIEALTALLQGTVRLVRASC